MKKMAIVYYSRSGNTEKMARLVKEGADENGQVETSVLSLEDFPAEKALEFDGLIIGSPTYYGHMAGPVKDMLDETVKYHGQLSGKVGGAFSSAANVGGGNETTVMGILQAMLIHGMIVRGDHTGDHYGPVSIGSPDERAAGECRKLGRNTADLITRISN